jgi:hypothetical protein
MNLMTHIANHINEWASTSPENIAAIVQIHMFLLILQYHQIARSIVAIVVVNVMHYESTMPD